MLSVHPYLSFNGQCEEAFLFYKSVFGSEFSYFGRYNDMPPQPGMEVGPGDLQKVMHVSLPVGHHTVLMGDDTVASVSPPVNMGSNFSVSVNAGCAAEARRIFSALAEGGMIKMPMEETFWGALFGMCTDRFGVHWMVNFDLKPEKE